MMNNEQEFDGDGFDWLIGRRIVKVEDAYAPKDTHMMSVSGYLLTCDDGTQLLTYENEGCGGCGNGWSDLPDLSLLANQDNAITNVEAVYDKDETFRLFIFYHDERFDVGSGDDGYGNGYYVGGFHLRVIKPVKEKNDEQ